MVWNSFGTYEDVSDLVCIFVSTLDVWFNSNQCSAWWDPYQYIPGFCTIFWVLQEKVLIHQQVLGLKFGEQLCWSFCFSSWIRNVWWFIALTLLDLLSCSFSLFESLIQWLSIQFQCLLVLQPGSTFLYFYKCSGSCQSGGQQLC